MVNGWHDSSGRLALSASVGPSGDAVASTKIGSRDIEASGLNRTRSTTYTLDDALRPGGGFQHCTRRDRSASISLCDNCAAAPFDTPGLGWLLSVSAAAIWRCGARLSRSCATWSALNFGVSRG